MDKIIWPKKSEILLMYSAGTVSTVDITLFSLPDVNQGGEHCCSEKSSYCRLSAVASCPVLEQ